MNRIFRLGNRTPVELFGYAASLGAAIGYGTGAVASRELVSEYSPPIAGSALSLVFGTVMVAALLKRSHFVDIFTACKEAWLFMSLSGIASAGGVALLFLALEKTPVVVIAPISGSYPLFAIAFTYILLQKLERITFRTMIGAVMVVTGVALITMTRT